MNEKCFRCFLSVFILLVICAWASGVPQDPQPKNEAEIRALIKRSRSKDLKVADEANQALSKLDANSLPALTMILKKGKACEQVEAAKLIVDLDPNNKDLVPALTEIARGGSILSLFNLQEEMMCRRGAAFLLAFSTDGIHALTRLLREGDLFERQSAIFAFDELTETSNYPKGSLQAMEEAIPVIAKATKDKDKTMSCMADEVLGQIARGSNDELSKIARKYLDENRQ